MFLKYAQFELERSSSNPHFFYERHNQTFSDKSTGLGEIEVETAQKMYSKVWLVDKQGSLT